MLAVDSRELVSSPRVVLGSNPAADVYPEVGRVLRYKDSKGAEGCRRSGTRA